MTPLVKQSFPENGNKFVVVKHRYQHAACELDNFFHLSLALQEYLFRSWRSGFSSDCRALSIDFLLLIFNNRHSKDFFGNLHKTYILQFPKHFSESIGGSSLNSIIVVSLEMHKLYSEFPTETFSKPLPSV